MRKIDKTKLLSTKYKEWVDALDKKEEKHPGKNYRYRKDVVMNLLHCQKGVCAYTEMFLCNPEFIKEDKWDDGGYRPAKPEYLGELEHFDPNLKNDTFWDWDNLFVVHSDVNRKKWAREVDDILKPDLPAYDPFALLKYDADLNVFYPHTEIKDKTITERVRYMIDILQLNYDPVRCERKKFLKKVFELRAFDQPVEIDRFFTAYEMVDK